MGFNVVYQQLMWIKTLRG